AAALSSSCDRKVTPLLCQAGKVPVDEVPQGWQRTTEIRAVAERGIGAGAVEASMPANIRAVEIEALVELFVEPFEGGVGRHEFRIGEAGTGGDRSDRFADGGLLGLREMVN